MTTPLEEAVERAYREGFRAGYCHRTNGGSDATDEPETSHWKGSNARTILNALSIDEERVARAIEDSLDLSRGLKDDLVLAGEFNKAARACLQSIVGEGRHD
jgi:hypothetical protein